MLKHYLLLLAGLMMMCSSCGDKPLQIQSETDELTALLEESPDSVYAFLQTVEHPEILPLEEYYSYVLLRIRAKAKCDLDISADTAIFAANDYFIRMGDDVRAAYASFYCGRILRKFREHERSLAYLRQAQQIATQIDDSRLKGVIEFNIGAVLSEIPEGKEEALSHFFKSTDYFMDSGNDHAEKLQHENKRLHTHRVWLGFCAAVLLLATIPVLWLLHYRVCQNRRRTLEAQSTIRELRQMAHSYNEKENTFRTTLLHHFNILRKAASLEIYISEESNKRDHHLLKVINEIVYGQETLNWELLYETMNQLHNGFFDRLHEHFPELDESEFRICCLSYTKFSSSEIALIMKLSINTVQMKRSSIRKKIGVESFGSLNLFFDDILK